MGATTNEVIMPIGILAGANTNLHPYQASVNGIAPAKHRCRKQFLLSLPINKRNKCGTIKPIKLITPTKAVATDTMAVFSSIIPSFSLSASTPRYPASSSP